MLKLSHLLLLLSFHVSLPSITFCVEVGQFKAIDIVVSHSEQGIKNVWDDVIVSGAFTAPGGRALTIHGFYHSKDRWLVRFAPDELGTWHYTITVSDKNGTTEVIDSFQCLRSQEQGFIRLHQANPKRWIYSGTGNLYTAVGFGDCMGPDRDSILQFAGIDGGYRPEGYHEGIGWRMPYSQYLKAYGDVAGFNIYRYSNGNCAYSIIKSIAKSGNDYDTLHSRWTDTLFAAMREHGFRIFMTIFGGPQGNASDSASMAATLRYVQYCIDRYGSLVDFWELTNESEPDSLWIATVANYFHAHDPYHHLVSMSNQKAAHPAIDIISPHWYGRESVTSSDKVTDDQIGTYRSIAKPVIFGEQGEGGWDSLSPMRLRGRIWSALFNEGVLIFWNSSFAKDCPCNQYLGWEERRYARVLQNFSLLLDSGVRRMTPRQVGSINVWELRSQKISAVYLRNHSNVTALNANVQIMLDIPSGGVGYWYDVHTGDTVAVIVLQAGQQTLTAPPFVTDIAFIGGAVPSAPQVDTYFRLDVKPRTVEFDAEIGVLRKFMLRAANTGNSPITLNRWFISSTSPKIKFQLDSFMFPRTINPSETVSMDVYYSIDDTGGAAAMLSLIHDSSPVWENVAISGIGRAPSGVGDELPDAEVSVYPDPATNLVQVRWPAAMKITKIRLTTLEDIVLTEKNTEGNTEAAFDVSRLPSGVYRVLLVSLDQIVSTQKVAVVH